MHCYFTAKKQKKLPILIKVRAVAALVIQERPQAPAFRSQCLALLLCLQGGRGQSHSCDRLRDAVELHLGQFLLLTLRDQPVQLCCAVANESFQVADKFVHKPLALHFADHVSIIVIPVLKKTKKKKQKNQSNKKSHVNFQYL